ncbi:hypothetical protein ACRALDRAFT_2015469 [Sodiomyces alcalophilus JCM 7366]|uniref:uncharacterized protein n=1 Tax=Sodiomyces alcalophilus JCM 7366 TaxID=591952 RepID=UPI0039B463C9
MLWGEAAYPLLRSGGKLEDTHESRATTHNPRLSHPVFLSYISVILSSSPRPGGTAGAGREETQMIRKERPNQIDIHPLIHTPRGLSKYEQEEVQQSKQICETRHHGMPCRFTRLENQPFDHAQCNHPLSGVRRNRGRNQTEPWKRTQPGQDREQAICTFATTRQTKVATLCRVWPLTRYGTSTATRHSVLITVESPSKSRYLLLTSNNPQTKPSYHHYQNKHKPPLFQTQTSNAKMHGTTNNAQTQPWKGTWPPTAAAATQNAALPQNLSAEELTNQRAYGSHASNTKGRIVHINCNQESADSSFCRNNLPTSSGDRKGHVLGTASRPGGDTGMTGMEIESCPLFSPVVTVQIIDISVRGRFRQ